MSTSAKSSSKKTKVKKPRGLFARINIRFPWLKLVAVCFIGLVAILDLLDLTISKLDDLTDNFPTTPMSKHLKATERDLRNKKLVALTFDDGPLPSTTPRLLDVLAEKDAIATFFPLGMMARNYPDILKRTFREGHEIASHTMYHQNLAQLPMQAVASDVNEALATFRDIIGRQPTLTRPPYGLFNSNVYTATNSPLILWSVDPQDWLVKDAAAIVASTMSQVHDGAIILMHDIYPSTIDAIPTLIDNLRAAGYELATISELTNTRGIKLSSGNAYYNFSL